MRTKRSAMFTMLAINKKTGKASSIFDWKRHNVIRFRTEKAALSYLKKCEDADKQMNQIRERQQEILKEYKSLLPKEDLGIFNEFILKGQGSSDPAIAADIARLTRSPKYLEMGNRQKNKSLFISNLKKFTNLIKVKSEAKLK